MINIAIATARIKLIGIDVIQMQPSPNRIATTFAKHSLKFMTMSYTSSRAPSVIIVGMRFVVLNITVQPNRK